MAAPATFDSFSAELSRLTGIFEKNLSHYKKAGYDEASLRQEFLNPLFSALGWDVENKAGHIPQKREVEVESRTQIGGRAKRADYLFRTDGRDRFVCEAKKPADDLGDRPAFQAKRYAWNKGLPLAEQTRIGADVERRLSVVEELESVVTANLQRATRLRQSILQKAFTGQLIYEENSA